MKLLLSGYYGFDNAGDEAVLAAMLDALAPRVPAGSRFVVTSGDPARTVATFDGPTHRVAAIGRQNPRALVPAIRACDVFLSGGGSLLQDVTSLRNVVYYTALIRFARLARKPVMIYAQGVGPLRRALAQKLARVAMNSARVITVRDEGSKALLQRIGVRRPIQVTADPVWALECGLQSAECALENGKLGRVWNLALRSWLGGGPEPAGRVVDTLRAMAARDGATVRCVPMQAAADRPVMEAWGARPEEIVDTAGRHPRRVMAESGRCEVMIAMRLHALIFAAAQGVPCVAINYDPKVAALAKLIDAPLLQNLSDAELARLPAAVAEARPLDAATRQDFQARALRNADLAAGVMGDR